jgi:hypothetical protein
MIDIVSGDASRDRDWAEVWLESDQHRRVCEELERCKEENKSQASTNTDDKYEFASSTWTQLKVVQARASVQIWRQTDYVINKIALHVGIGLLYGFSWWMIVHSHPLFSRFLQLTDSRLQSPNISGLQNRLFTSFGTQNSPVLLGSV